MKKKISPIEAKQILSRVPPDEGFWLCTNQELRSIREMVVHLKNITDEVFRYHVNRDKNDFEAWLRDFAKDKELAREISRVKTKETLLRKIQERYDELKKIIEKGKTKKKTAKKKSAKKTTKTKKKKKTVKKKTKNKKTNKKTKKKRR